MIIFALRFLKGYWHFALIGLLLITLSLTYARIKHLKANLAVAEAQSQILSSHLEKQNHAIKRWHAQAEKQRQEIKQAEQELVNIRNQREIQLKQIDVAEVQPGCTSAMQWGAVQAIQLATRWSLEP